MGTVTMLYVLHSDKHTHDSLYIDTLLSESSIHQTRVQLSKMPVKSTKTACGIILLTIKSNVQTDFMV